MTYSTDRDSLISAGNLEILLDHAASVPPGAFVEVGVYRGGSARALYRLAEAQGRALYLYDTFAGHPEPSVHDGPDHPAGRFADCADPDALRAEMPNAWIIPGRFSTESAPSVPVAFAHVDVDLYDALAPLMVPGGIMYFDDYGVPGCDGATRAVHELFANWQPLPNGKALVRF
jgi:O-methyltransferase